jgi:hypothetical protein
VKLIINDEDNVILQERGVVDALVAKIAWWGDGDKTTSVYTRLRDRDGFLEWIVIRNADAEGCFVQGQSMTIGMIQRQPGAPFEFHS